MKVIRHPDQFLISAVWRAIEQPDKAKWSIVIESVFGKSVKLSGADEPYRSPAHLAIQSVLLRHEVGHEIKITRDTNHLQDEVSAKRLSIAAPTKPPNVSAGSREAKKYEEEKLQYNAKKREAQDSADSMDMVFSNLVAALGASAGEDDSRVEAVIERREAQLSRFEQFTEDFVSKLQERRAVLEAEFSLRKEQLEQQWERKWEEAQKAHAEQLKGERSRLETDIEKVREQLRLREEAVSAREKAADDSDNRAARRKLQEDIKKVLGSRSQNFSLTRDTTKKRWPVIITAGAATAAFLGLLSVLILYPQIGPNGEYTRMATQSALALGFGGALVFLLRFTQQWAKRHADEEFYLKRLELDLERASWLVEMSLEYANEAKSSIPPEMFERLSRGLFAMERGSEVRHPLETLLGAASEANVRLPHADVRLKRNGLRTLQDPGDSKE